MAIRGMLFSCLKQEAKQKKDDRLQEFEASALCAQMEQHTRYHWSTALNGQRLEYWPSVCKWRWKDKNYWGSLACFENFLRKRGWSG